jgi:hypothetical protein
MDVSLVNKVLCIMAHAQVSDKQRLVVYYPSTWRPIQGPMR